MKRNFDDFIKVKELNASERRCLDLLDIDFSLFSDCYILPGFTDVHVHLREPGFLYKETIRTGTLAAAAGGFTDICSMPNLDPCPDSMEHLQVQLDAIKKDAQVRVHPYGAITVGEAGDVPAALEEMAEHVIAYTDDGRGVASESMMQSAMERAKRLGKIIVAHCEEERYPRESAESEWKQVERDIELVRRTGCAYHVCHVSTKESLQRIRNAKRQGLDITCETAPHYLTLTREEAKDDGRFKMNPPIKGREDRAALIEAVQDGTVDMIATDHAPHSAAEKSRGFAGSAFGIVGLETAFPVLYTRLVLSGLLSLDRLIALFYGNPRRRFGLPVRSLSEELERKRPNFAVWDLDETYEIDPATFLSKGRSTPFAGWQVQGRCLLTVVDGKTVWRNREKIG